MHRKYTPCTDPLFIYSSIKPSHFSGSAELPPLITSTMRGFAEVLLLVACTLIPSLFANGLQGLLPTINHGRGRRNAVIRGLLVSRQGICETGFVVCEAIGCCPIGWNCCDGSSLPPTFFLLPSSIPEQNFFRWQLL